ncbi:threonine-phosphate decarboxylase [Oscillatoria sp. FACHB-1407]|uniref:threonine-phosphate decarboxylase CobD n=1 Tax=Oscillatoria sp. FACHB-1407 TaxID=2692847 RepID=UPI0016874349|nr:threonine-phosphate decarboxylase CobD [Oscillatoria sp. FACHB-1407]MBD2462748.1 threonine-phosphate decarboxylase [Oscillatoria sp. FACHB-1407]
MAQPTHGGNITWAAELAGCSPSSILDFSASINPLGPPQSAIAAIQASLSTLRDYPDPDYRQLRSRLSQVHNLAPEWILPGNGSAELLTWASRELAELSSVYLMTPAFSDYLRALKAFHARIVPCPLDLMTRSIAGLEDDVQQALQAMVVAAQTHASCGLLINNPHNPTGHLLKRAVLLSALQSFDLVVVDEAFMDFLPHEQDQSVIDWVQKYANLVVLRSLTKFYSLPGLRLGYAIAHPDRLRRWQQWRDPWSVNTPAAAAAEAVLGDYEFQQQTWNWLAEARSHLFQGLSALPGLHPYPGAANYLLVRCDRSAVKLQHQLLKQHQILIRDCVSFPELGDRFFRVAVRTQAENQRLLDGLTNVLRTNNLLE